jgi:hypothetical protein
MNRNLSEISRESLRREHEALREKSARKPHEDQEISRIEDELDRRVKRAFDPEEGCPSWMREA